MSADYSQRDVGAMPRDARLWPKIVAITNEDPDWPEADKREAGESWVALLEAFERQGYTYRAFTFFDDLTFLDAFDPREWLVWNWGEELAGRPWSDAEVADQIEQRGFAYTGSPPQSMRLAQDRMRLKRHLQAAGLPTPPGSVLANPGAAEEWTAYPAIVKGANQHASIGIDGDSVVHSVEDLARRVIYLRQAHGDDALVEPFLDTREFHVAVWGNESPEALPPAELDYSRFAEARDRLYTYAWKTDRASIGATKIQMPCPAPLDRPDWRARLEAIAVKAYQAVGLRDYGRFDMRMLGDEPQILDVNCNPELWTDDSVFVAAARARGMAYAELVARIVEFAAVRMPYTRAHTC
jgi:D-alanine-D-alanine ligase